METAPVVALGGKDLVVKAIPIRRIQAALGELPAFLERVGADVGSLKFTDPALFDRFAAFGTEVLHRVGVAFLPDLTEEVILDATIPELRHAWEAIREVNELAELGKVTGPLIATLASMSSSNTAPTSTATDSPSSETSSPGETSSSLPELADDASTEQPAPPLPEATTESTEDSPEAASSPAA